METINETTATVLPNLNKVREDILRAVDKVLDAHYGDSVLYASEEDNSEAVLREVEAYYEAMLLRIDDALYDALLRWA